MRSVLAFFAALLFASVPVAASAQACTGLCLQQVSCPAGQTTTITGTVYAPNGLDPLPDILVYIPNAPVAAFTPGVACPVVGAPPSGSPIVGATTNFDGTFTLSNVPVGANIPIVIQTGRWRRQVIIPVVQACVNTAFNISMPKNQTEGDIPKFAIASGSADQVECVLRKVGIDDSEFTNSSGTGRINFFSGAGSAGAEIDSSTPNETALMGDSSVLNSYDVLMLPCQGGQYIKPASELANIIGFANAGGRIYSSHFSYVWMYNNPPWNTVANWAVNQPALQNLSATIDQTFSEGVTLAQWMQFVGATTTPGQIPMLTTTKHDMNGVTPPPTNQSWLTLNDATHANPVMQFVFDAPVAAVGQQCGRVLFNEYHVENPASSPKNLAFPTECSAGPMSAQEKLLEYSLFELTSDGNAADLEPKTQDFGTEAIGFNSPVKQFTWQNNSTFSASVNLLNTTGDFTVVGSNCASVASGKQCQINVVFNPTALGSRTGVLTVGSAGSTQTATLSGTGIPDLTFSTSSLTFPSTDVGATRTQFLTVTNSPYGAVPGPTLALTGDFSASSNCPALVPANATCTISVSFTPTVFGMRTGSMVVGTGASTTGVVPTVLTGNGVDFGFAVTPASGTVIAGYQLALTAVTTPEAGFASGINLSCTTNAPDTTCTAANPYFQTGAGAVSVQVTITTGSKYTVIGYGGAGRSLWLLAFALASGFLLLFVRRRTIRVTLIVLALSIGGLSLTGCDGTLPSQNKSYTPAGSYTFTVSATDGFLVHSATYGLNVTVK